MADDMIAATKRELERWPGASVTFTNGGKHLTATLAFGGRTRKVICAQTLSDNARGTRNHVSQVRRELKTLGAEPLRQAKSSAPKRQRNRPTRPLAGSERAPVVGNPFEALAAIEVRPAPSPPGMKAAPSLWSRIRGWFRV